MVPEKVCGLPDILRYFVDKLKVSLSPPNPLRNVGGDHLGTGIIS